jgi:hypothetical protein
VGLYRKRPKKCTTKAKEHQEKTSLLTYCIYFRLCDLCVFVVHFAVFGSVRRCQMAMAADMDLNELPRQKYSHPIA